MGGVVYVSCTPVGRHIIRSHLKHHPSIPVAGLVNLDRREGAGKANYDSLYDLAVNHGVDVLYCGDVNAPEVLSFVKTRSPVLLIQSGWSQKFGGELLSLPKHGCIGEHPSPIPVGRGAACVNWALIEGRTDWGDSFFRMVDKYDAGPVYAQSRFQIEDYDTVFTVYEKVGFSSHRIIRDNLHKWCDGEFSPLTLDETKATYYKKRRPKDGELDFAWDDRKIYNYVRALTKPYPGAFFRHGGNVAIVWQATLTELTAEEPPGTLRVDAANHRLLAATGNKKMIALDRVQVVGLPEVFGHEFFDAINVL